MRWITTQSIVIEPLLVFGGEVGFADDDSSGGTNAEVDPGVVTAVIEAKAFCADFWVGGGRGAVPEAGGVGDVEDGGIRGEGGEEDRFTHY